MIEKDLLPALIKKWAYKYRSIGWNVIPLYEYKKALTETPWKKYETYTPTNEEFDVWFSNPKPNLTGLALVTGKTSGVVVIDEDQYASPENVFHIDSKMTSQTASGGRHKIFKDNPEIDKRGLERIELKNLGSIIVLPPSVVYKKPYEEKQLGQYKWLSVCPLSQLPTLCQEDFYKYRKNPNTSSNTKFNWNEIPGTIPGTRHGTLMSAGMHLWNQVVLGRMNEETAWTMFIAANNTFEPPKEDVVELKRLFSDAKDYVYKNPPNKSSKGNTSGQVSQQASPKIIPKPMKLYEVGNIRVEERKLEKNAPSTGYLELDRYMRGFIPKHLITFTGDTNVGKTAQCANFAVRVSLQNKMVLYIALEPDTAIVESLASARTGKRYDDLTDEDITYNDPNIEIYTNEIRTMDDLKLAITQLDNVKKYDLIILDHIGYFVRGSKDGSYIQEQANLLKDLATFANDKLFAILLVAHLRKPQKYRKNDKIPTMDDISGSAAFKQDSDEVLILTRNTNAEENGFFLYVNEGLLVVAKTKSSGGNGVVNVIFSNRSAFITTASDTYTPPEIDNSIKLAVEQKTAANLKTNSKLNNTNESTFEATSFGEWDKILSTIPQELLSDNFDPQTTDTKLLGEYKLKIFECLSVSGNVRLSKEFNILLRNQAKLNNYLKNMIY